MKKKQTTKQIVEKLWKIPPLYLAEGEIAKLGITLFKMIA